MLIERLTKARTAADLLSWFCLYYALMCTVLYVYSQNVRQFLIAALLLIPFAGTVLLTVRAKNALLFIGYHILVAGLLFVLSSASLFSFVECCIIIVCVLIQMVIFFLKRVHTEYPDHVLQVSPILTVIFFICWLISSNQSYTQLSMILVLSACVFLLCGALGIFLTNILRYIEMNKDVANLPVSTLIRAGCSQMAAFLILAVIAILLFTNIGLNTLASQIGTLLLLLLRFLLALGGTNEDSTTTVNDSELSAAVESPFADMDGGESAVMIAISNVLLTVLRIALVICVVILIILVIYQMLKRFNGFSFERKKKKMKPDHSDDVIEKLTPKNHGSRRSLFSPTGPDDRIRKIYYKKIQGRHKKEPVNSCRTPSELTDEISPADAQAAKEFTAIYEESRYSNHTTQADPSAYKALAKKV